MQRIHGTAEFDEQAVARGLDDPPIMPGDARIDQLGPNCFEPFERALLTPREGGRVEPGPACQPDASKNLPKLQKRNSAKKCIPGNPWPQSLPEQRCVLEPGRRD
jgi:hypothetical protein